MVFDLEEDPTTTAKCPEEAVPTLRYSPGDNWLHMRETPILTQFVPSMESWDVLPMMGCISPSYGWSFFVQDSHGIQNDTLREKDKSKKKNYYDQNVVVVMNIVMVGLLHQ